MANRLEATAWDAASDAPVAEVAGLPYVWVVRAGSGEFLTSSRLEAHRLASPYVHASTLNGKPMFNEICSRLDLAKDTPLNRRQMARAVAELDPFCLLHGVFFSQKEWWGQPKFERAISAVIEARDVQQAINGGRKSDRVRHQLDEEGGGTAEGYGSVCARAACCFRPARTCWPTNAPARLRPRRVGTAGWLRRCGSVCSNRGYRRRLIR